MSHAIPHELLVAVAAIAALYSTVGHGGASGYLAVLALAGVSAQAASSSALMLNLIVAGIAFAAFGTAGHLSWRLSWPFLIGSAPFAFLGGSLKVSEGIYGALLAAALSAAALRLILEHASRPLREIVPQAGEPSEAARPPVFAVSGPVGAGIGLVSGIVGVGGGIFLSPLMILLRWATPKQASATTALFILVNSAAGLLGRWAQGSLDVGLAWPLLAAGIFGAFVGSSLGSWTFSGRALRQVLGVVLAVAAAKIGLGLL